MVKDRLTGSVLRYLGTYFPKYLRGKWRKNTMNKTRESGLQIRRTRRQRSQQREFQRKCLFTNSAVSKRNNKLLAQT